ncbi:MAG: protein-disulfide reductase DsbD family protein [Candidatus Krumholzibacteriia bacterium]
MKRTSHAALAVAALLALAAAASAGGPDTGKAVMRGSADVVTFAAVPARLAGAAGERVSFRLDLSIDRKWHLYAHEDTMFIGVDLLPAEDFALQDLQVVYPPGKEGEFFGEKVLVLEGDEAIHASAVVPDGMAAGEHDLALGLTVQACDDKICLAPAVIPVHLKLTVQ